MKVPKLRRQTFETAIIERYRRRDISIEEAIVQMYLAGVSVQRVEDITEALWGTRVSSGTVSNLNRKVYEHIERWRNQAIEGECAYVYLDGLALKRSWGGEIKNVSVLAAIGVDAQGYRRILGVAEGHKEDKAGWLGFLKHLKKRGLSGVRLIVSDACLGLAEAAAEVFPDADWQRCVVHFYRNVFSACAAKESAPGGRHAQGDPRPGEPSGSTCQSPGRDREVEDDEAGCSGGARGKRDRGDADLLLVSLAALDQVENQQSDGTIVTRGAPANQSGRRLPGRSIGAAAGGRSVTTRLHNPVGLAQIHECRVAHGDGQGTHLRSSLKERPEPPLQRKCEKSLTLPVAEGHKEDKASWLGFLKYLKKRGACPAFV